MSIEALYENITKHLSAIDLCIENHLRMPALILIYSGIDIFAAIGRPKDKDKATRADYINWCDNYMLKDGKLSCSAIDLYAARCGIVHTYSMHSQLSESGKAKEIIYSWGTASPDFLQNIIDSMGKSICVIHVDTLVAAFKDGITRFISEMEKDTDLIELIVSRAGKLFKDQSKDFWLSQSMKG